MLNDLNSILVVVKRRLRMLNDLNSILVVVKRRLRMNELLDAVLMKCWILLSELIDWQVDSLDFILMFLVLVMESFERVDWLIHSISFWCSWCWWWSSTRMDGVDCVDVLEPFEALSEYSDTNSVIVLYSLEQVLLPSGGQVIFLVMVKWSF